MRAPEAARAASSQGEFIEAVITHLFQGIALTADQALAARAVIAGIVERQAQIDLRQPGGWGQLLHLNEERNVALAALLGSDTDQALFEANAAEDQLAQAQIAWRTQTAVGQRGADAIPRTMTSGPVGPAA
jgi:hypothetical protein